MKNILFRLKMFFVHLLAYMLCAYYWLFHHKEFKEAQKMNIGDFIK